MRRALQLLPAPGWAIVIAATGLAAVGMATIYVADTAYAARGTGSANAFRQGVFLLIGVAAGLVVLRIGHQRLGPLAFALFGVALLTLAPLLIARLLHLSGGLLAPRNGAYRWIHLPVFQVQPSELMKVAFILALAWYLRYRRNYRRLVGLLIPFAASAVPLGLILLQPDLGTVLLLAVVLLVMMYLAGAQLRHLGILLLIGALFAPVAWFKIRPYQRSRITAVLLQSDDLRQAIQDHPEHYEWLASRRQAIEWASSSGFQLVASKRAIGSGGLVGHGWGRGVFVEHKSFLPDRHNDLIFALVAHQWGFVGSVLLLMGYLVIAVAGAQIALATNEPFSRLLAGGVVALLITQVIINIGVALGLMPITGMTLPFVSYGGSSLLTNCIALALLLSVARYRPFLLAGKPFEFVPPLQGRPHLAERVEPRRPEPPGG